MATIKIHDLSPAGSELFQDSESFLNELTDEELGVHGGLRIASVTVTVTVSWTWTWTW
ncbi:MULTISPECIES: hypothetical protein [Nostoc]|uniref:Uncharacterized protein n=1 Tax=Nostoc paludosum FACHB-159 TaxID=2692908 RepID=A0ABR8JZI5_9NOSO|nr:MULTISPECIES: hypothetical protein [Nostoc]MBD2676198.1 hypothetical protein [Nostoc sp. FACHB-857]MBD2732673.1 hypothetical protein [Nostoc paludosum FACHB-159]